MKTEDIQKLRYYLAFNDAANADDDYRSALLSSWMHRAKCDGLVNDYYFNQKGKNEYVIHITKAAVSEEVLIVNMEHLTHEMSVCMYVHES